jgi:serine O-acetyltransferase
MILTNLNLSLHGFDMPPHIEVGPRLFVPHPVGTVVTARRIGSGVTLVSAITIGMRNESDFPVIGDGVYVGAGARILGNITIGDRAQIGANAVVLKDVPADHVAVGVPATIRPARAK